MDIFLFTECIIKKSIFMEPISSMYGFVHDGYVQCKSPYGKSFWHDILMSAHGTKQCSWTAASEAVLPNLELQGDEGQETQKQYYT